MGKRFAGRTMSGEEIYWTIIGVDQKAIGAMRQSNVGRGTASIGMIAEDQVDHGHSHLSMFLLTSTYLMP